MIKKAYLYLAAVLFLMVNLPAIAGIVTGTVNDVNIACSILDISNNLSSISPSTSTETSITDDKTKRKATQNLAKITDIY